MNRGALELELGSTNGRKTATWTEQQLMDSRAAQKAVDLRLQARPPAAQNEAHMAPAMGGGR